MDPALQHRVVALSESLGMASQAHTFKVNRRWNVVADHLDPVGDDAGPHGRDRYPADATWGDHRQMDVQRVTLSTSGASLKIDLALNKVVEAV